MRHNGIEHDQRLRSSTHCIMCANMTFLSYVDFGDDLLPCITGCEPKKKKILV
jgi:hypothetical protein